jgi:hypothetical protein
VSPRAVVDAAVKRKISSIRRESNSRISVFQSIAQKTGREGRKSFNLKDAYSRLYSKGNEVR